MKTSARNQIEGIVLDVKRGAVNGDVTLDLGDGQHLIANITLAAIDELELKTGKKATALVKASFVILTTDFQAKISTRNRLAGTISSITPGSVNSEVRILLASGHIITAIVTCETVNELSLEVGKPCAALVKASHVILAVAD